MTMTRDEIEKLSDEELNVMVATEVMGWEKGNISEKEDGNIPVWKTGDGIYFMVWAYAEGWKPSKDIAAAWQVLETFDRREWDIAITSYTEDEGKYWGCELTHYSETGLLGGSAASYARLPRAISIASVLAKMQP